MRVLRKVMPPSILALVLVAAGCGRATDTAESAYPTRAITLVTAFSPGGTTDLVGRMAGEYLGKKWNVPINVVNKPGGNTVPANLDVGNASPDGYTLLMDTIGSSVTLPTTVDNLPFNVLDRSFVCIVSSNPMLIFVAPGSPIKSLKDAVDEAKRDPKSFTWTGIGVAEIPMRQLLKEAGVDIAKTKPIVSSGSVAATVLVNQGSAKVGIAALGSALSPVASGIIRPLAIAGDARWKALPDVPTTAETGFPTVRVVSWIGVTGPPKLPSDVVNKWNEGVQEMLRDPKIAAQLEKFASVPNYRDPTAFKDQVSAEIQEVGSLWKQSADK